jgi:CRP/FNR family cyclic AMP-dependent transcriptional regulator
MIAVGGKEMIQKLDAILGKHPFFKGLNKTQLKVIEGCAKNTHFAEGKTIFLEGDPADAFYFIQEGSVSIELTMPNHPRSSVHKVGEGDILGWSWVSPPYKWHFNARALKATKAIAFDARCLRSKLDGDHELGYELLKRFAEVIVQRLDATQVQLLKVTKES